MTRLVIDSVLRERLGNCDRRMEICDESGRRLAYLVPAPETAEIDYEKLGELFTDEELEEARQSTDACTTAELLAYLRQL